MFNLFSLKLHYYIYFFQTQSGESKHLERRKFQANYYLVFKIHAMDQKYYFFSYFY